MKRVGGGVPELGRDDVVTVADEVGLAALAPAWAELHRASGSPNPFVHPAWISAWVRCFGERHALRVVAVRRAGELVAVAPYVRRRFALGPASASVLQLVGAFSAEPLSEMPEVLCRPADRRTAVAAVVRHLASEEDGWDWLEVALPREGWHEESWLPDGWKRRGIDVLHKGTRAFVVLPLPPAPGLLRPALKRNMREALRRAEHRLAAAGGAPRIDAVADPALLEGPLSRLVHLHRARAATPDAPAHRDYFADPAAERFLREGATGLAAASAAAVHELRSGGSVLASRLVLRSGSSVFLSCSGFDPAAWRLCAPTALMASILEGAVEGGATSANLSLNPDQAKLRWSEQLELHNDFVLVAPRRRSRILFGLYWQRRAAGFLRPS